MMEAVTVREDKFPEHFYRLDGATNQPCREIVERGLSKYYIVFAANTVSAASCGG
jgi:hypothetical protein